MFPEKPYIIISVFALSLATLLPLVSNSPTLKKAEKAVIQYTERRTLAVWIMFFSVIGLRLAFLPALRVPTAGINDEFSYLLMSDTFAHGRLANPTPAAWVSFETPYVNSVPTYSSIYPPAQGFALMIGQLLGHPWIGVLLSNAAMCASVVWMLQAWVPPRWAFLAGIITALQFSLSSYWMNSYWGGAVATAGGALVLGAVGRIRRAARLRDALLLGLGIAVLANSRPYEGIVLGIPTAVYLLLWMLGKIKTPDNLRVRAFSVLLPLLASMVLLASFIAYYDWRLTGNPFLLPHVLYTNNYHHPPTFLWQGLKPPIHLRNTQLESLINGWSRNFYHKSWADAGRISKEKLVMFSAYLFNRAEWLLLPFVPFLLRDKKMRLLLLTLLIGTVGIFIVVWGHPHYAAPFVCVVFALLVQTMRHMNTVRVGNRRYGSMMVRVVVIVLLAATLDRALEHKCDLDPNRCPGNYERAEIAAELSSMPGKHLVLVRYNQNHNYHLEWVHNGAELDSAKILWAHELDTSQNERLFAYFKDRKAWLMRPDAIDSKLVLQPYPLSASPPASR